MPQHLEHRRDVAGTWPDVAVDEGDGTELEVGHAEAPDVGRRGAPVT